MRLPDVVSAEERSRRWWARWRAADFSWASIAGERFAIAGDDGDPATLQAQWRADPVSGAPRGDAALLQAGELERDPGGRLWHIVHVPSHWEDGTPTWKADRNQARWERFWDVVRARLDAANTSEFGHDPDGVVPARARLTGVVFGDLPQNWDWHEPLGQLNASFPSCAFLGVASFLGVVTHADLDLRSCLFSRTADFDLVGVHGALWFDGSTFESSMRMKDADVAGAMHLSDCDCHGEISLLASRVDGAFKCDSAVFHAPCLFDDTTFAGEADFAWCRFLNLTSFVNVRFRAHAAFVENVFATDVDFAGRCYGDLHCIDCSFEGSATFTFLFVRRDAWFAASRFKSSTQFQGVRWRGKASFRNAVFESAVRFDQVIFRGAMEFHNTVFEGLADFAGCEFPADARCFHGAFRGADFRRTADFSIEPFTAWGAFVEATFQQRLLFSRRVLRDDAAFDAAFDAAGRAAAAESKGDRAHAAALDRRLGELEAAFQALKQGMARQQARLDQHRFYRLELLARRRHSEASAIERGIIWLYDASSLCGTSFTRPLLLLVALVAIFGLGYWASAQTGRELLGALNPHPPRALDPALVDALRFSAENVLKPLAVWTPGKTTDAPRELWSQHLLADGGAFGYLVIRLVATLQSLLSIALLFLCVLGFKRHFEMTT
ncbi:MAG: pentapeptide repeat-containing protein [Betaproteobacteria bacterium]